MGLMLGYPNIVAGLFLGFLFGAIIGSGLVLLKKKGFKSEIPFGPFLLAGLILSLFYGERIINWYLSLSF
jgi:leader peptidase (prepilin peptidase)/N-methyltransferase